MDLTPVNNTVNLLDTQNIQKYQLANHNIQKERQAAQDFEALFIQSALKEMRPKLDGGLFNDGLAVDVFYQFMDEAIAQEIARSPNNFGLADELVRQNFK